MKNNKNPLKPIQKMVLTPNHSISFRKKNPYSPRAKSKEGTAQRDTVAMEMYGIARKIYNHWPHA